MNCDVRDRLLKEFYELNREHIEAAERVRITPGPSEEYEQARADRRMAKRRQTHALRQLNFHAAKHGCFSDPT
jgi:hypothetical protein